MSDETRAGWWWICKFYGFESPRARGIMEAYHEI